METSAATHQAREGSPTCSGSPQSCCETHCPFEGQGHQAPWFTPSPRWGLNWQGPSRSPSMLEGWSRGSRTPDSGCPRADRSLREGWQSCREHCSTHAQRYNSPQPPGSHSTCGPSTQSPRAPRPVYAQGASGCGMKQRAPPSPGSLSTSQASAPFCSLLSTEYIKGKWARTPGLASPCSSSTNELFRQARVPHLGGGAAENSCEVMCFRKLKQKKKIWRRGKSR